MAQDAANVEEETRDAEGGGAVAAFGELAGAALDLVHNTVRLAACEARMVLRRLAMRLGFFILFLVIGSLGLLLVLGGLALLLQSATSMPQWLAFVIVGAVTSLCGAIAARRAIGSLSEADLAFPGLLEEFGADVEALRGGTRKSL